MVMPYRISTIFLPVSTKWSRPGAWGFRRGSSSGSEQTRNLAVECHFAVRVDISSRKIRAAPAMTGVRRSRCGAVRKRRAVRRKLM
jgi:hypothetical protein